MSVFGSVRCVVLDMDDTLYLERDYVRSGFAAVGDWMSESAGIPSFAELCWRGFRSGIRNRIFDHALQEAGLAPSETMIRLMVAIYRGHTPRIELLPDALELLQKLQERRLQALVTDGPIESQRRKVEALGLAARIPIVIYTAALGPEFGKPDPRSFALVQEKTACSGRECLYAGDNPQKDFLGPRALGWRTFRVRRAGSLHEGLESGPDVDAEAPDLAALAGLLGLAP